MLEGRKPLTRSFRCLVSPPLWRIEFITTSGLEPISITSATKTYTLIPAVPSEIAYSDGTNFYVISGGDATPGLDRAGTTLHKAPAIAASAVIGPGPVPFGLVSESLITVWYAFASGPYLSTRNNGLIRPFHNISLTDVAETNDHVTAYWESFEAPPWLPRFILTHDHASSVMGQGKRPVLSPPAHAVLRVLSTETNAGLVIPSSVQVDYYFWRSGADDKLREHRKRSEIQVNQVIPNATVALAPPPILEPTHVSDMRFWFAKPPQHVSVVCSNDWPSENALKARYLARQRTGSPPRMQRTIAQVVLALLLIGLPLALWWIRTRMRH